MSTWSLEDSFFFRVEKVSSSILEADKSCLFVEPVADVDEFDLGVFDMTGVLIPVHHCPLLALPLPGGLNMFHVSQPSLALA
jgi:hypothetical protein